MSDSLVVIGSGLGGLSAAIRLAASGRRVVVLEQNASVGGKMGELRQEGFRWDTGPSVITMRHVLEELFKSAGRRLEDYLTLQPIEPLTRYFFPDGKILDISQDKGRTLEHIAQFDERDVDGYRRFLDYVARLYRVVGPVFIYDRPPALTRIFKVSPLDALRVDGLRSMSQAIEGYVRSPYVRQLLGRFATYVGASPYLAPATLNVIAHVELNMGVWYPQGGVYALARAVERLAQELGVEIRTHCPVQSIEVQDRRARGVRLADGTYLPAKAVIANLDVTTVYEKMLPPEPAIRKRMMSLQKTPSSCSGFILLLGVRGEHPQLKHHNIFFSSDYRREFEQIFKLGIPPQEPTIYVSITQRSTPEDAPPGCENWFVLVNAPPLGPAWDWRREAERYAGGLLDQLARRGFDVRNKLEYQGIITPKDLEGMSGARGGALYGTSSNSRWAAFRRPHNRAQEVKGLYFAGGTVHPGGGVPMVILSGKVASELLLEDGF